jgi:hypothetical protein
MTAVIVGDRARLPNGFDLTGTRMDAQCFSARAWAGDGTGDKIACGTALGDDLGDNYAGSFSVSFWAKNSENDGSNNDGVYEINGAGDGSHGTHACYYFNSTIRFALDGNAWYRECALVGTSWHHFVLVYTAGSEANSKVYIDGLEVSGSTSGTFPAAADLDFAGDTLTLGLHNSATYDLNGSISDWKFFKIALTAAQALELYEVPEQALPTGATAANLRSWYPLADYDIASANNLDGLYMQDCGSLGAHGLCTNGGMEFSQPNIPQLGLRSSSSRCLFNADDTKMTVSAATAINQIYHSAPGGSIAFWCFAYSMGEGTSGRLQGNNNSPRILLDNPSGDNAKLSWYFAWDSSTASYKTTATDFPLKQWVHVVFTYDGSDAANDPICYINGDAKTLTKTGSNSGSLVADSSDKLFGSGATNREWDGIIDTVAMWKGASLDADAVSAIYAGGRGFDLGSDSGNYDNSNTLAGYWRLDNPVTIQDLTDNNNDGTMSGTVNMATVPEGTTADLSVFGALTNNRPSFAWSGGTGVNAYNDFSGNVFSLPDPGFGTANYTIAFWYRCTAYPGDNAKLVFTKSIDGSRFLDIFFQNNTTTRFSVQGSGGSGQKVDTSVTVTAAQQIGSWIQIVLRREAAATHSFVIHPLDASAVSTTDETSKTPANIDSDSAYGFRFGGGYDETHEYGAPSYAQFAFPRIWVGEAITDAQVNALYESGARMLRGT